MICGTDLDVSIMSFSAPSLTRRTTFKTVTSHAALYCIAQRDSLVHAVTVSKLLPALKVYD